jgi:hypothetical protein
VLAVWAAPPVIGTGAQVRNGGSYGQEAA